MLTCFECDVFRHQHEPIRLHLDATETELPGLYGSIERCHSTVEAPAANERRALGGAQRQRCAVGVMRLHMDDVDQPDTQAESTCQLSLHDHNLLNKSPLCLTFAGYRTAAIFLHAVTAVQQIVQVEHHVCIRWVWAQRLKRIDTH